MLKEVKGVAQGRFAGTGSQVLKTPKGRCLASNTISKVFLLDLWIFSFFKIWFKEDWDYVILYTVAFLQINLMKSVFSPAVTLLYKFRSSDF